MTKYVSCSDYMAIARLTGHFTYSTAATAGNIGTISLEITFSPYNARDFLGRSTDGGGSGLKFFKIILLGHRLGDDLVDWN